MTRDTEVGGEEYLQMYSFSLFFFFLKKNNFGITCVSLEFYSIILSIIVMIFVLFISSLVLFFSDFFSFFFAE